MRRWTDLANHSVVGGTGPPPHAQTVANQVNQSLGYGILTTVTPKEVRFVWYRSLWKRFPPIPGFDCLKTKEDIQARICA